MYNTISVIIPVKPSGDINKPLSTIKKAVYPSDKIEIIISEGYNPVLQRNKGIKEAKGDILYFTNSDCELEGLNFKKLNELYNNDPSVAAVGGPDTLKEGANIWQKMVNYGLSSYFSHNKMSSRYKSVGSFRISDEKEVILHNLSFRKGIFEKIGHFNINLYPNDETAFINRLKNAGYKVMYHPDIIVHRERKATALDFYSQMFKYGGGRANQIKIEGTKTNIMFFIPVLFILYMLSIIFYHSPVYMLLLLAYILFGLCDGIIYAIREKDARFIFIVFIYFTMHLGYGLGMLKEFLIGPFMKTRKYSALYSTVNVKNLSYTVS